MQGLERREAAGHVLLELHQERQTVGVDGRVGPSRHAPSRLHNVEYRFLDRRRQRGSTVDLVLRVLLCGERAPRRERRRRVELHSLILEP